MKESKKQMADKIQDALLKEIEFIRHSNRDLDTKVDQIEVLFDTIHFLRDYDKNIDILNKALGKEKYKE